MRLHVSSPRIQHWHDVTLLLHHVTFKKAKPVKQNKQSFLDQIKEFKVGKLRKSLRPSNVGTVLNLLKQQTVTKSSSAF